jgi:drug/metabolite transporter (DMT)-like permease
MKNAYVKYIVALLLFGSNGIVASYIVLNSYEIVYLRTLIGSVFLIVVFILSKQKAQFWKNKTHFLYLIVSGVAMGASWILLYEAYTQVGVSIATLIYYCGPVIVMILSPFIFNERMTRAKLLGFLAVIIGMLCLNGQAFAQGKVTLGLIFGILSAITYALMVIFNKKARSITGVENATCQLVISFITVAISMGIKQGFSMNIVEGNWIPILILGIVNTGIGCYFYFSSIGQLPAQSVSILGYIEPLSALVFSAVILLEKLTPLQMIGAALILGGAAFGELFRSKSEAKRVVNENI